MSTFHFTLIVDGPDLQDESHIDTLFEAGCDDATVGCSDGVQYVDFDREASDVDQAILSAVDDLEILDGVEVVRIADAGLVSLADIAVRVGRTRESIRLLVSGGRGPGGFPKPVTDPRNRYRLWRWSEVAHWFKGYLGGMKTISSDELTATFNAALEFRHRRRLLADSDPVSLRDLVGMPPLGAQSMKVQHELRRLPLSLGTTSRKGGDTAASKQRRNNAETNRTSCCALCDKPIRAKNSSREHVVPNAIGGRKTVRNFLCKDCNSATGAKWDHELFSQLKPLCTLLNIRRQRGENRPVPVETVGGDELLVHADGRMSIRGPSFSAREVGSRKEINIRVPSMKELKRMVPGLVKKYPKLDIHQLLQKATPRREYIEDPLFIPLTFGGELAGRSIVKSCLALASEAGLHLADCEHARDYLLANGQPCFGYYNATDVVQNRPSRVFFHCVFVCGDPLSGQVLGYVEYFGFQRMVLCLSSSYHGPSFSRCYSIDPISGNELDIEVSLTLSQEDIAATYLRKNLNLKKLKAAIDALIEFYMERATKTAISAAAADAVEYAFANCGVQPGERLSDEHRARIGRLIMERVEPFLVHLFADRSCFTEDVNKLLGRTRP